jgi:hypothetical protein
MHKPGGKAAMNVAAFAGMGHRGHGAYGKPTGNNSSGKLVFCVVHAVLL